MFFNEIFFRNFRIIFEIENWLWKSEISTFGLLGCGSWNPNLKSHQIHMGFHVQLAQKSWTVSISGVASVAVSGRLTHQSSTGSLLGNMRSARDRDVMNLVPPAAECSYAACFCEENVWKLCDHVRTNSPELLAKAYVVFVSNKKQVNIFCLLIFKYFLKYVVFIFWQIFHNLQVIASSFNYESQVLQPCKLDQLFMTFSW